MAARYSAFSQVPMQLGRLKKRDQNSNNVKTLICSCLCGEKNENKSLINAIIIDEVKINFQIFKFLLKKKNFKASQCLEVDCLIPLRFGCNKFILVGDPEQLPATVLSKVRSF